MMSAMVKRLVIALGGVAMAGCASFNSHKGAVIDTQLAASIQPGIDNKESVRKLLGSPTMAGQFSPSDWYYVSRDQTQLAFRDPHLNRHQVLHIKFDQAGNVASIGTTGREVVMNLTPSGRSTPTLGRERSFFEELFGGIGSVNSAGAPPQ